MCVELDNLKNAESTETSSFISCFFFILAKTKKAKKQIK